MTELIPSCKKHLWVHVRNETNRHIRMHRDTSTSVTLSFKSLVQCKLCGKKRLVSGHDQFKEGGKR